MTKVEEAMGTEMPLETIPCADNTMIQTSSPINPKWSPQDAACAKLFGPWDNLPCYDHINEVRLLRDLDNSIVLFEEQINHSDAGFRVWQNRHKQAMEAGLVEVPGFPCLQSVHKGRGPGTTKHGSSDTFISFTSDVRSSWGAYLDSLHCLDMHRRTSSDNDLLFPE